jgi:preprotein translocase subunit YajC
LIKINRTKLFPKVILVLTMSLFLVSIITIVTPVAATHSKHPKRILVMAKGDDIDIAGGTTSIIAKIEFDKASGTPLVAQVEFHTKIYDESGEKIYSMKGKLKDGLIISRSFQFYCTEQEVTWINLWFITGMGKLKTTDADIEIEYRGQTITLPNTGGQYIPFSIFMWVNPKGEHVLEDPDDVRIWPQGGWATAGIMIGGFPSLGGVTYLTRYIEI